MTPEQFYPFLEKSNFSVQIDSRKITPGDVFFAFSGENFNAATLAKDAITKGAVAVIIEDELFAEPENHIFYVPGVLDFLQQLASYHRDQLEMPILGLTGSNGKTTTKELIASVLKQKFKTAVTEGNLNNHIGVPLTVLKIHPEDEFGVVEMGANHKGEIAALCEIAKPTIGLITNFGKAHLEGFGGFEGVIIGKSEMYDYLRKTGGTILFNANDPLQIQQLQQYENSVSFGEKKDAADPDYCFEYFEKGHLAGITYDEVTIHSQLTGSYNAMNLAVAATVGLLHNIDIEDIADALEGYAPQNMRSQIIEKNNKKILLDTYNANPSSMSLSIANFHQFEGKKMLILGDMLEMGAASFEEHEAILRQLIALNFSQVYLVGPEFSVHAEHFREQGQWTFIQKVEDLEKLLKNQTDSVDHVLIKGSRGISLEKALEWL